MDLLELLEKSFLSGDKGHYREISGKLTESFGEMEDIATDMQLIISMYLWETLKNIMLAYSQVSFEVFDNIKGIKTILIQGSLILWNLSLALKESESELALFDEEKWSKLFDKYLQLIEKL